MEKDSNKLRASAIWYAQKYGWAVFPLKPREKTPQTSNGFKDATKDLTQILQWWQRWPDANIGIATGAISGFWVLDIDKDHGGFETLDQLIKDYSGLPRTVESLTGSGGNHMLFAMPDFDIRNNASSKLGTGLDIRGNGGYIVAPPSIHPCGEPYMWEPASRPGTLEFAPAPGWLLDKLKQPAPLVSAAVPANGTPAQPQTTGMYVSKATLDFFANGAPVGMQRMKALAAARNYMSAGYTVEQTIAKVWQGLQLSENEPGKSAWTEKDAAYLVNNLHDSPPPPMVELESKATPGARYRQIEIEWICCAAAYLVPEMAKVEMGWLTPAHFSTFATRHFWELFLESYDKDHAARESGTLAKLLEFVPVIEPHLLSEYAQQLANAAYMVSVSTRMAKLSLAVSNGDLATTRRIIKELDTEAPTAGRELETPAQQLDALDELLDNPLNLIKTFIDPLDRGLRGLPLRFHSVWAARPGLGKTTLLWQIAYNVAISKRKVLFKSLEMSAVDLWGKKACGILEMDWFAVLAGEITPREKTELRRVIDHLKNQVGEYLLIDDRPNTTDTIWQSVTQYQPELVLVDHLRLLKDKGDDNTVQRLGRMTSRLKEIAKMGNCHVATIHQINRGVESRDDKEPQLSDLRDSGLIEEDVDLACFLYRDSYYDKSDENPRYSQNKLIVSKNRFGKGKPPRIIMEYDSATDFYQAVEHSGEINLNAKNGHYKNGHNGRKPMQESVEVYP